MSDAFYARAIATAKRLIAQYGGDCTLRVAAGSGDAWNPVQTETDYTVKAVSFGFKNSEIDGTLVQRSDRKVYVSTEGVTVNPKPEHKIVIDSETYSIVSVMPLKQPTRSTVYWQLQVRA